MSIPIASKSVWPWLTAAGAIGAVSIGIVWPLRTLPDLCIAISVYPPPPGCGSDSLMWGPILAITLIVALFASVVVVAWTVEKPRVAFMALIGSMLAVLIITVVVVLIAQAPLVYPGQPLPYLE